MRRAVIGAALVLAACTTGQPVAESWVGAEEDQVLRQWGPPAASITLSDGSVMHEWSRPVFSIYMGNTYCEATVHAVDAEVDRVDWRGPPECNNWFSQTLGARR